MNDGGTYIQPEELINIEIPVKQASLVCLALTQYIAVTIDNHFRDIINNSLVDPEALLDMGDVVDLIIHKTGLAPVGAASQLRETISDLRRVHRSVRRE